MTKAELEAESIEAALANLRASGYRILSRHAAEAATPDWLKSFEPDFVAQRGGEFLVVEVKRRRGTTATARVDQLSDLAAEIDRHPGWELELVWLGDEGLAVSNADVDDLIARAERVLKVDAEAALLLIWQAVDASLQLLASRVGIRVSPAPQLLSELYSFGWLSKRHFEELENAQEARNEVAHRVGKRTVKTTDVLRLAEIARRLASPQYVPVDQMVDWFHSVYMDPANGVPFNSREGGYLYINGGPYDALVELSIQYPDALPEELEEARHVLELESLEWVRQDEY